MATVILAMHTRALPFGRMFLLLVFLSFLFDEGKELHWLGKIEEFLSKLKLDSVGIVVALGVLLVTQAFLPLDMVQRLSIMVAGAGGVALYVAVDSLGGFFEGEEEDGSVGAIAKRSGVMGFLYLEGLMPRSALMV